MFAPWFYRNVVNAEHGPIVRLSLRELSHRTNGDRFEALAYLHPSLSGTLPNERHEIYGHADGTGSDVRKNIACHKAISEALERWAFYDLRNRAEQHKNYGLDVESSSSGFAAWPGIFTKHARQRARLEAIERWALAAWWTELIGHKMIPAGSWDGIELKTPFLDTSTVILFGTVSGVHVYGFATRSTQNAAIQQAETELLRNIDVLQNFTGETGPNSLLYERRLKFFSSDQGREVFSARLASECKNHVAIPKTIIDLEVRGPWTKYAKVWRVLFEPIHNYAGKAAEDFFLF